MINRIKEYIVSCLIKVKRKYKIRQLKKYYKVDTTFFVEQLKNNIDGKKTLILTVSFNNEKVIEKQIELLSKFCKDEYIYLVADNSTILEKSNKIEKICHEGNVYYYRLPANNPFNNYDPSSSHGASLNYIWRNIISKLDNVDYIMMLDHDIFPTSFFSVKEMLKKLKEDGRVLCTASSKPEVHIETTFRNCGITDAFDYICGGSLDESRCGKPKVIEELLRRIGLTEEEWKTKALMIGDRKYDAEGAALFGIPCLGTSMGFAPEGELEAAGVCGIVHSIEEMTEYILAR